MVNDRDTTLRRAERFLKQGRLDAAITEYQRLVEEQPGDWNSANALGDLLVRVGRVDEAVVQYSRIADHLAEDGFLPKAAALYRKILKIRPDDDHAAVQAAEVSVRQGLIAPARSLLAGVIERRRGRGDRQGASELIVRLGALDPSDAAARIAGARALADLGDGSGAARQLLELGQDLLHSGREQEGVSLLGEAARLDPASAEIQETLVRAHLRGGDLNSAMAAARNPALLKEVGAAMFEAGRLDAARHALQRATDMDPADTGVRALLARSHLQHGDLEAARACLGPDDGSRDPDVQLARAELLLRSGERIEGRRVLVSLLTAAPERRRQVIELAETLAPADAEGAFHAADAAVAVASAAGAWGEAATVLHRLVSWNPLHVPGLMRLVEVCIDGGLGADVLRMAQESLADAYHTAGRGHEARVIAEDLVIGAPWDRANVDRLRRAFTLLGEPEPDRLIADRLTDSPRRRSGPEDEEAVRDEPLDEERTPTRGFELGPNAIDVTPILAAAGHAGRGRPAGEEPGEAGDDEVELIEVDLSTAFEELAEPGALPTGGDMASDTPRDLENVFEDFRQEVSREHATEEAEQQYRLALAYRDMGLVDEAIAALERAARSPRRRFDASALLGRLHLSRNRLPAAIEWFERAAEAPATTLDEGRALLYELAETLERSGERARALAVFLELHADARDYRDVAQRVAKLTDESAKE